MHLLKMETGLCSAVLAVIVVVVVKMLLSFNSQLLKFRIVKLFF